MHFAELGPHAHLTCDQLGHGATNTPSGITSTLNLSMCNGRSPWLNGREAYPRKSSVLQLLHAAIVTLDL